MSNLVDILPSILTGLFALVGVYVANAVQVKSTRERQSKEKLDQDLERLEQLYEIIDELKSRFLLQSILYLGLKKGDFTKQELHEKLKALKSVNLRQAKMIVGIHFPNLAKDMDALDQACLFTLYVHGMVHAENNASEEDDIIENLGSCTDVCDRFLERISTEANIYIKAFKSD